MNNTIKFSCIIIFFFCFGQIFGQKPIADGKKNATITGLNFDACLFTGGYFKVGEEMYEPDELVYLCLVDIGGESQVSIAAHFDSGDLFPSTTIWSGEGLNPFSLEGPQTSFERKQATSTIVAPYVITAMYEEDGISYSMKIKIIVVGLEFEENNNQNYGFDDNRWPITESYPSNEPPFNYSWKSVKLSDTDIMDFIVEPMELKDNITLTSSDMINFPITPIAVSSSPQEVSISANIIGTEEVTAQDALLGGCSSVGHHSIVKIVPYQPLFKMVSFILVAEENDDETLIPKGQGAPNIPAIGKGANDEFESMKMGDDEIEGEFITTGLNGIRETPILGDDIKLNNIEMGQGKPNSICVIAGSNEFRDTPDPDPSITDDFVEGNNINTGNDGICQTEAKDENINAEYLSGFNLDNAMAYVNNIYKGAVFNWIPESVPVSFQTEAINYDIDRDGKLYLGNGDVDSPDTEEVEKVLMESIHFETVDPNKIYVFITDYGVDNNNEGVQGYAKLNTTHCFVFPGVIIADMGGQTLFGKTIAHELGHAGLGLRHPFSQFVSGGYLGPPYFDPTDPFNLMDYANPEEYEMKLRKYQWDEINY